MLSSKEGVGNFHMHTGNRNWCSCCPGEGSEPSLLATGINQCGRQQAVVLLRAMIPMVMKKHVLRRNAAELDVYNKVGKFILQHLKSPRA